MTRKGSEVNHVEETLTAADHSTKDGCLYSAVCLIWDRPGMVLLGLSSWQFCFTIIDLIAFWEGRLGDFLPHAICDAGFLGAAGLLALAREGSDFWSRASLAVRCFTLVFAYALAALPGMLSRGNIHYSLHVGCLLLKYQWALPSVLVYGFIAFMVSEIWKGVADHHPYKQEKTQEEEGN